MTDDEYRQASMDEAMRERAAFRAQEKQHDCPHDEHEHGYCLDCGKDITDDLVSRAEAAADAREDR